MNMLVTCVGRRVGLIKKLKEALNKQDRKLYVTDIDSAAPALYFADDFFLDTVYTNKNYLIVLVKYCIKNNITSILTLHDKHLLYLSKNKSYFQKAGISLLMSSYQVIKHSYDKASYDFFPINQIPTLIIKDREGSAGSGVEKIQQPFLEGDEYNIQCYFDFINGGLKQVFMQRKILMRAGETDRSVSVWFDDIYDEVKKLDCNMGFRGVVDIDCIRAKDKVYIIDINPRFGGGYLFAHGLGCNFVEDVVTNSAGKKARKREPGYELGRVMMKYNTVYFQ